MTKANDLRGDFFKCCLFVANFLIFKIWLRRKRVRKKGGKEVKVKDRDSVL